MHAGDAIEGTPGVVDPGGIVAVGKDDASVERGRVKSLYETDTYLEEGAS